MNALSQFSRPEQCGVEISVCQLDNDDDIPLVTAAGLLSPAEHERAARFRFARDRDRFVRGRGYMRQALARATGGDPAALLLEAGSHGKPFLQALPGRPVPQFNLSHSGGLAVLVVSWDGPVGIDLEFRDRTLDPLRLASNVLVASERQALDSVPTEEASALFLSMWTAKEARMKLTGEGMALDPRAIELTLEHGWPVGYRLPVGPAVRLDYPDLGRTDAVCALARYHGPAARGAA